MQTMKPILIGVGLLIVAAVAYILFIQPVSVAQENDTNSQAKIDINAVCEGALAYMSFENGAAAEAWVAECKNGEHPEAIEQWKQMNGITDDRAI